MDNLTDGQLMGLATDLENQPNQYGLIPEVVGEIIAAREWARRFYGRYHGCKVTAAQMLKQANEEIGHLRVQHQADDELVERVVRRHDEADKESWRLLVQNTKLEKTLAEVREKLCTTRLRMWELEKRVRGEEQDA